MRRLVAITGVLLIVAGCVQAPAPRLGAANELPTRVAITKALPQSPSVDVEGEAARLRAALTREVAAIVDTSPRGRRGLRCLGPRSPSAIKTSTGRRSSSSSIA